MTVFSERMGYKPSRSVLQVGSMDENIRFGLWNVLDRFFWSRLSYTVVKLIDSDPPLKRFCVAIWADHFKWRLDTLPIAWNLAHLAIRNWYLRATWDEVYSFIEFTRKRFDFREGVVSPRHFERAINYILERELAGYRLVSGLIVPITSPLEIAAVEEAQNLPASLRVVEQHLEIAVTRLADKPKGDYRNSIKESISAVEAMCSIIAGQGKADLEAALRVLEKRLELHPALKAAFGELYGYTSDEDGIRHALLQESTLTAEDAKFMLVTCSAFVNYLKALVARAELQL
jgi:AbiJ-like protein